MLDWLQVALLVLILFYLIGLRRPDAGRSALEADTRLDARIRALEGTLEGVNHALSEVRTHLGEFEKDSAILDELEANVMGEWARIIEEKLGKKPIMVPCPTCKSASGLEPNLLVDEDTEFGCPNCGAIFDIERLREIYPEARI